MIDRVLFEIAVVFFYVRLCSYLRLGSWSTSVLGLEPLAI
jgi:hypothetical protein